MYRDVTECKKLQYFTKKITELFYLSIFEVFCMSLLDMICFGFSISFISENYLPSPYDDITVAARSCPNDISGNANIKSLCCYHFEWENVHKRVKIVLNTIICKVAVCIAGERPLPLFFVLFSCNYDILCKLKFAN